MNNKTNVKKIKLSNFFIGLTTLSGVLVTAKLLGIFALPWAIIFSPIIFFVSLFFLAGLIYASCLAALNAFKEDMKKEFEEIISKNTEDTMVMMATVISSQAEEEIK